jgi:membrane-bound lytic murein transglycosylase D
MAWFYKIPPMISALAFGYGVGMATPEAAIDDVESAVRRYARSGNGMQQPGPRIAHGATGPAYGYPPYGYPPPGYPYPYANAAAQQPHGYQSHPLAGVPEPPELAKLRGQAHAASCKLHDHRQYSEPRNQSYGDETPADYYDPNELDPAGKEALSRLQLPDFNVAITRKALNYVRFLTRTHRGRDMFTVWMKRSGRYAELVQQTLREWKLPEDLIWVAMIESGFDPRAKSPAGAMGMWQFMQSTGEVYGLNVTPYVDERKNPVQATRAAAHHLRDLFQRFGSWDLAFAAYNMGYEQLLDRIDRYGTTDFAELARQRALPKETSAYVPKIIAAALVANNLERYGFEDVKVYKPMHIAELSVPGGTRLSTIAKAAGISSRELRKYNPHFRKKHVPPGSEYVVLIPPTRLSRARAALPAMMDSKLALNDADILAPTDLFGLSGNAETQARHQAWSEDENLLQFLPKPRRRSMRSMLRNNSVRIEGPRKPSSHLEAMAEEFTHKRTDRETVMYRVGSGDTLIGLAKQFAVDIDDLARDNGLDPEDKLREGALLKILVKRRVLDRWKLKKHEFQKSVRQQRKKNREEKG